ncbi:MAG: hypothetical protein P0Y56_16725 [Candidatus Andeanibacterium colombiense]|uniref:VCBS repeat-containing protein n=1 Tax=Candidatus Andeanibacterium colombiense TaxID=3121345 RepID=A0AAJ6BPG4_9SPHN|nr:MAG: hypothetical protein P0Y56_16725 [Sphingomonadaceae bacterium]
MRASRHLVALALVTLNLSVSAGARPAKEDEQFRSWLVHWMSGKDWADDPNTIYGYALADLNGDGRREALVWTSARGICGTGGCRLAVFERGKAGWQPVSGTAATRLPIRILASRTRRWNDLGVVEAGGGIREPYEGRLRFDGKHYDVGWTAAKVAKGTKGA